MLFCMSEGHRYFKDSVFPGFSARLAVSTFFKQEIAILYGTCHTRGYKSMGWSVLSNEKSDLQLMPENKWIRNF